ncbi:unnamed protein product, partial [Tilletia caries]
KVHKWPRDWQNKAVKILRSVFGSHYEIKIEDAEPTPGSQTDDFNQLDKTTQALMRLAKEKQKSVPIHDAVDDWLGGITMVQIENGKPVYVDPLRWWWSEKQKGNEYSGLANLALDVFGCPATSVEVERLFSRAGRVVTPLRHRLKAHRIAQLVTVGKWFDERSVPENLLPTVLADEENVRKTKRKAKAELVRAQKRSKTHDTSVEEEDVDMNAISN